MSVPSPKLSSAPCCGVRVSRRSRPLTSSGASILTVSAKSKPRSFPGYVFCQFDPERALTVVTTPAVHRILTVDAQPAPVSPAEIESVRRASEAGLATPAPYLTAGRRVRVVFGPLAGVEGLMVAVRSPGRLIVNVETLHRAIAAEVDLDHVIAI